MSQIDFEKVVSESEVKKRFKSGPIREILEYLGYFAKVFFIVTICYILIRGNVFDSFNVSGASMMPNYIDGEKVYIDKITPQFGEYGRGDVVIVERSIDECHDTKIGQTHCYYIKRIVGLPGEQVFIEDGSVYIMNEEYSEGVKLDESSYLSGDVQTLSKLVSGTDRVYSGWLGTNEYYVLGDNRAVSQDSRSFGKIEKEDIQGKEFFRPKEGFFDSPEYNISD